MATAVVPSEAQLPGDVTTDVCIVGGGIAGLTTAYLLTREGKRVSVIDDGPTAGGETCRTTAHLVTAVDDRFSNRETLHGVEGARLAAQVTRRQSTRSRESFKEGIDCDFARRTNAVRAGTTLATRQNRIRPAPD
jgi:glycine/D-amino acid oxidase-like deaminating enzyme